MDIETGSSNMHQHLLHSRFEDRISRYDWKIQFMDFEHVTSQETYIINNKSQENLKLVVLPPHSQELQLNMNASDGSGDKLIIMSRSELDEIHADVFALAAVGFMTAKYSPPKSILRIISRESLDKICTDNEWLKSNIGHDEESDLIEYFDNLMAEEQEGELTLSLMAVFYFLEYVILTVNSRYRPVIFLRKGLKPHDNQFGDRRIIQYKCREQIKIGLRYRIMYSAFGNLRMALRLPFEDDASNHFRILPPRGTSFSFATIKINPDTKTVASSDLYQIYRPPSHKLTDGQSYPERLEGLPHAIKKLFKLYPDIALRLSQTASTRFLVAVLYFSLLAVPVFLYIEAHGINFTEPMRSFRALPAIYQEYGLRPTSLIIPLGVALLLLAWDRPGVRPFAFVQIPLLALITIGISSPLVASYAWAIIGIAIFMFTIHSLELGNEIFVKGLHGIQWRIDKMFDTIVQRYSKRNI